MELIFLGTASCYPTADRSVSCTLLRFEDGRIWMFDCGEGSQVQLQKSSAKPGRIEKIFITHLHGDHLFGLPGLLCTLSNNMSESKSDILLEIFGPHGLRRYVRECLSLSRSMLNFSYVVHELIIAQHQYPDDWQDWKVDSDDDGRLHPQEIGGRSIVCDDNGVWEVNSDIVVHEATLEEALRDKALENGHSTPAMAAQFAKDIGASVLVLYHYSQRYRQTAHDAEGDVDSVTKLLAEAEAALSDCDSCSVVASGDLMEIPVKRRE
ncbi:zinc phosphodiesterase ELAC protein 1-like isoform X3 [Schistocerca nitens]|uniref:zinc phosphodiesterase ELAC protein 1-like isoform X3 n=1 Tax=Schistocerca nitens TaxID=7011 RepID=UPI002117E3E5|nr:zinc phosphodiesterase ELAC protein 1-like isoform X3 [Schistocerca nitens]